jgi:hypothetical protein
VVCIFESQDTNIFTVAYTELKQCLEDGKSQQDICGSHLDVTTFYTWGIRGAVVIAGVLDRGNPRAAVLFDRPTQVSVTKPEIKNTHTTAVWSSSGPYQRGPKCESYTRTIVTPERLVSGFASGKCFAAAHESNVFMPKRFGSCFPTA